MTQKMTQKEIAGWLDTAAARSEIIDRDPATRKQIWFMAGLMARNEWSLDDVDCAITNTQAVLTKRAASRHIDELLAA